MMWVRTHAVLILSVFVLVLAAAVIFLALRPLVPAQPAVAATQPVTVAQPTTTVQQQLTRRETGQNQSLHFNADESAYGWKIVFDDGNACDGGNCYIKNSPIGGTVTSGVVNPWQSEIVNAREFSFTSPTATPVVYVASTSSLYNIPPQPQIGHPSLYVETGVPDPISGSAEHTKTWTIQVLDGTVAIVGGFTVNGTSNGVYKAVAGPTTLTTTVTNGFLLVTKADWANAEWCFRISQAIQYGWAHNTESPLRGWTTCQ